MANLNRNSAISANSSINTSNPNAQTSRAILPKIPIRKFHGDLSLWPSFKQLFISLIKEESSLSDAERFHYLVSYLEGAALEVVKHIPVLGENFEQAWTSLLEVYDNKRKQACLYLDRLLNFRSLAGKPTADSLQVYLSQVTQSVTSLQNLGITNLAEYLLCELSLRGLDPYTREAFETSIIGDNEAQVDNTSLEESVIVLKSIVYLVDGSVNGSKIVLSSDRICSSPSGRPGGIMPPNIEEDRSNSFVNWVGPIWESSSLLKTSDAWMDSRRRENAGGNQLWRVHDKLYDLNKFADVHPGGKQWINLTRGTDITEAFECHHFTESARNLLPKFFVRDAETARNSPFTFEENGFYCTLRKRVVEAMKGVKRGPTAQSKMFADFFATATVLLATLAAVRESYVIAAASAVCLCCVTVVAHNFFHQRDNFRMYYWAFCGFSVKEWRISHSLSHHLFPNSRQDLELTAFEPIFQWAPRKDKSFTARFFSWLYSPIVYCFLFHSQWISRLILSPEGALELIPLILPAAMMFLGNVSLYSSFVWWNTILVMGSFCFFWVALNAAHHHPELLHDGDEPRNEEKMDWGIYQIDAVRDRGEIYGVFPLVIVLFGDHTLHHLFPTIDHFHLYNLYPVLKQTCSEFGIEFKLGSLCDLIRGQFLQLARNYTISFKAEAS
ncbi:hypothetical protein GE061_018330 [Apolygus lucorum]|uniref:Cytochrome b5 heme-binding domain-containing protein n=1 Tax=Apolygus lucorum TaxID=248454 RepID=A0A8S9XFM2_APOLU|nr:hypothetical protein GE061_018330 [Apolygus lucorum]